VDCIFKYFKYFKILILLLLIVPFLRLIIFNLVPFCRWQIDDLTTDDEAIKRLEEETTRLRFEKDRDVDEFEALEMLDVSSTDKLVSI
jgi:hypothetical protein